MKTDHTRDKKEGQIQDERARDYASRFKAERYLTDGFCLHFHRNTELYCINRGQVSVLINGENRVARRASSTGWRAIPTKSKNPPTSLIFMSAFSTWIFFTASIRRTSLPAG